jgi:PAS domain S-box-containing protein
MTRQFQEYVRRAKEAEARARSLGDDPQKGHWLEIANGYRNMAQARLSVLRTPMSNDIEHVLANTPFLLTRCSADLDYLFASEAYARMIGRHPSDIAGKKIRDVMGEQGLEAIRPHVTAVLSGQRVEYQKQVPFEGMGARLLHVIYTPDRDGRGHVMGWVASIIDITDKRGARIARRYDPEKLGAR